MMTKTKNLQFVFILLVIAGVLAFSYWNITQARIYNPTGAATADANTWTGLQTLTGFISSASSTVASSLQISGRVGVGTAINSSRIFQINSGTVSGDGLSIYNGSG